MLLVQQAYKGVTQQAAICHMESCLSYSLVCLGMGFLTFLIYCDGVKPVISSNTLQKYCM